MDYNSGKQLFAFAMSQTHGPVLSMEFVVDLDGSLKYVKSLDRNIFKGLHTPERKFKNKKLYISGDAINTCHGRTVILEMDANKYTPNKSELVGHIIPVIFKPFELVRTNWSHRNSTVILDDVDSLFVFDPEALVIEGPCETYHSISGILHDDKTFKSVGDLKTAVTAYIEKTQQALNEAIDVLSDPLIKADTISAKIEMNQDELAIKCTSRTSKVPVQAIRVAIDSMMTMALISVSNYENAEAKRTHLIEELARIDKVIAAKGK
jgi:hypothetical protein